MSFECILSETRGRVGLITLDRPEAMNALNTQLISELLEALGSFDQDERIGAVVITGSEKAFAAGADIKEMQELDYPTNYREDLFAEAADIAKMRKPVIAAVSGYALGGGCELAMMCDFIIASESAKFGQPEITLGVIPGIGGTQRLIRAVGKAKAMDMVLSGRMMDAEEAEYAGLVSKIVPTGELVEEALRTAEKIAGYSLPAVMMAKEMLNRSFETTLEEGLRIERRLFHSMFAFEDQTEGMTAFIEKRAPNFKNR